MSWFLVDLRSVVFLTTSPDGSAIFPQTSLPLERPQSPNSDFRLSRVDMSTTSLSALAANPTTSKSDTFVVENFQQVEKGISRHIHLL